VALVKILKRDNISIIYCNGGLPCQLAVPAAKLLGIPVLCHFHHPAPKRYYYLWLVKFVDAIIFPSNFVREHSLAKANMNGAVVFNGVDTKEFRPAITRNPALRKSHGILDTHVVIGQVGAFVPTKRHVVLLSAFHAALSEMPNLRLVLVGEGPERARIEDLARHRGLADKVTFTGYVESAADYFQNVLDINVLVSSEEGLGIVLLQGSACGLPNIGTDCTGIREAIRHGETGYLFKEGDVDDLTRRIVHLAKSPEMRKRMGEAGRRYVEATFSVTQYAERIIEIIIQAARSFPGTRPKAGTNSTWPGT